MGHDLGNGSAADDDPATARKASSGSLEARCVAVVNQRAQEEAIAGVALVIGFAPRNIGIQIGQRAYVARVEIRDLFERLVFPAGQAYSVVQAQHANLRKVRA